MKKLTLILASLLVLCAPALKAQQQPYTSTDYKFQAMFPGPVKVDASDVRFIQFNSINTDHTLGEYIQIVAIPPDAKTQAPTPAFWSLFENGFATSGNFVLRNCMTSTYAGYPADFCEVSKTLADQGVKLAGHLMVVFNPDAGFLYTVTTVYELGVMPGDVNEKLLDMNCISLQNSLTFLKP